MSGLSALSIRFRWWGCHLSIRTCRHPLLSGLSPSPLPTWVPLSGAEAPVGIAVSIIEARKHFHHVKVAVPQEGGFRRGINNSSELMDLVYVCVCVCVCVYLRSSVCLSPDSTADVDITGIDRVVWNGIWTGLHAIENFLTEAVNSVEQSGFWETSSHSAGQEINTVFIFQLTVSTIFWLEPDAFRPLGYMAIISGQEIPGRIYRSCSETFHLQWK
jgi:hypothetical protein